MFWLKSSSCSPARHLYCLFWLEFTFPCHIWWVHSAVGPSHAGQVSHWCVKAISGDEDYVALCETMKTVKMWTPLLPLFIPRQWLLLIFPYPTIILHTVILFYFTSILVYRILSYSILLLSYSILSYPILFYSYPSLSYYYLVLL